MSKSTSTNGKRAHRQPGFESERRDALEAFETALATPLVEGEMAEWSRLVQHTWSRVAALVRFQLDVVHRKQFKEIAETDPEMFKRVEELESEDVEIRAQLDNLAVAISHVSWAPQAAERTPAATVSDVQQRIIDAGIAFVVQVRKQEVAINTWFQEAFNRDRGVGD